MTVADPQAVAEASVRHFLAADTTARALGITVSQVAPGAVTAHLVVGPQMVNGHGSTHGAALFAVADIAFAMACNSHAHMAIGRTCTIEYLAPSFEGEELVAVATERALEGRNGIYDVSVRRASDGVLLAEMRAHSRVLPIRPA